MHIGINFYFGKIFYFFFYLVSDPPFSGLKIIFYSPRSKPSILCLKTIRNQKVLINKDKLIRVSSTRY